MVFGGDAYIPRVQLGRLAGLVVPGKVVVLYGPRQAGKMPVGYVNSVRVETDGRT